MVNPLSKIEYNSPVILTYALVSLAVLGLDHLTSGDSTLTLFSVYASSPLDPAFYLRLFGHVLGHANISHYLSNMMLLLLVGPMVEEKYGSRDLLVMIGITALVTGLVHVVLFPRTILLGASGVVFMLIVLSSVTSVEEGKVPLTLIVVIILYLGEQVIDGVLTTDSISQLTHILGGVLGAIFGLALGRGQAGKAENLEQ